MKTFKKQNHTFKNPVFIGVTEGLKSRFFKKSLMTGIYEKNHK